MNARVFGEVNMDFIPVTHNKKAFETESEEYVIAEVLLGSELKALVKSAQDFVGREKRNKEVLTQAETYVRKAGNAVGKVRESAPSGAVITTPPKRSYEPEPGRSFLQNLVGEAEFVKSVNDVKSSEESKSARVFRIEFEGKAVSYSHSFGNL